MHVTLLMDELNSSRRTYVFQHITVIFSRQI